ncbi:hypothetical protein SAMN05216567_105422 [Variovorax sp. OK605]|jgi:hypothetical protein|nr:hypothetical protein SAMN05518853_10243 [Variovorax sp. OK202]SFC42215.1 hypothetical protein SAMN05444746_10243 [Variovorax sp. OK212]SFP33605.1 hypothetical protein SAMN05216567_105422 [Variovorax sp. OK605]
MAAEMNYRLLLPLLALLPGAALAATLSGTLRGGGGTDDMHIVVQSATGERVTAYCDGHCGDWFDEDAASGGSTLKKKLVGRQVLLDHRREPNRDRIAGPGPEEQLDFARKIELLK